MKQISYIPNNICAKKINITINEINNTIEDIEIYGGCDGNHKGIISLCKGMKVDDVILKLEGIKCGPIRGTSCPDQLAKALKEYKNK